MSDSSWYLEGYFSGRAVLSRIYITHFPFLIGRQEGLDFQVPSNSVSRIHAELSIDGGRVHLHDRGSTNGTFVNHERLQGAIELRHGDVIHFGDYEVRLIHESTDQASGAAESSMTVVGVANLSDMLPTGIRELQELLDHKWIIPAYQPIIDLTNDSIHAYEILGRGRHPSLSPSPGPLFRIAESMGGLATQLSQMFRDAGIYTAATFNTPAKFFFNIHPDELMNTGLLIRQMESIRAANQTLPLVLEINEQAATNLNTIKELKRELAALDIQLAYDDFGAGQARMLELVEAPANYLKFDINMVRNIHTASPAHSSMISMLVGLAKNMGIKTLAEGIEQEAELERCREIGFDLIQGFIYGKPTEGQL